MASEVSELDDKYHYLIGEAQKRCDWAEVDSLKRDFESKRRNLMGDNSDESYFGNYYKKTFGDKE